MGLSLHKRELFRDTRVLKGYARYHHSYRQVHGGYHLIRELWKDMQVITTNILLIRESYHQIRYPHKDMRHIDR